jgi:hypothetical protein
MYAGILDKNTNPKIEINVATPMVPFTKSAIIFFLVTVLMLLLDHSVHNILM